MSEEPKNFYEVIPSINIVPVISSIHNNIYDWLDKKGRFLMLYVVNTMLDH